MSAAQARAQAEAEHAATREAEAACRLRFLVYGDTFLDEDGEPTAHECVCVCTPTCSRDYDPFPYPEAEPVDSKMYAGTEIGALYGLGATQTRTWRDDDGNPVTVEVNLLATLAGWNVESRQGSLEARDAIRAGQHRRWAEQHTEEEWA